MQIGTASTNGKIADLMILAKTIGYNTAITFAFFHLDFLFVKPYVKTPGCLLNTNHIKILYKHIREDGTE